MTRHTIRFSVVILNGQRIILKAFSRLILNEHVLGLITLNGKTYLGRRRMGEIHQSNETSIDSML